MALKHRYSLVLDCPRAAVEVVQSLGRAGVRSDVIAERPDCLAFHSRYVRHRIVQNLVNDLVSRVEDLDAHRGYRLIVPSSELPLLQLLQLPERSDLRRRCVLASNAAFEVALSKARTLELAAQLGIPAPASARASVGQSENPELGFPRVLKPIQSTVFPNGDVRFLVPAIVTDRDQRNRTLARLLPYSDVIEQEYVSGTGVGVELLFKNGNLAWHFAHERVHELPLTGGASSYRCSIEAPRNALEFSVALLEALNWHGVAMVEFKRRLDGTLVLMEINPRLWGSLALSIDCGVDFPRGLLDIAEERKLSAQRRYHERYYTRYLPNDVVWMGANLVADHGRPLLLTRPRLKSLIEYLRPLIGKESWDHFAMRDPAVTAWVVATAVAAVVRRAKTIIHVFLRRHQLRRHHRKVLRLVKLSLPSTPRLLFVCYGNICRSPFAAKLAASKIYRASIACAGFGVKGHRCSPAHVCAVAAEFGINLEQHRSATLTDPELRRADLILLMDGDNFDMLKSKAPHLLQRATLLGFFSQSGPSEIRDPYDMSLQDTRAVFEQIKSSVVGLAAWLSRERHAETTKLPSRDSTCQPVDKRA